MKILRLFALLLLTSLAHAGARQDAKVVMGSDPDEAKFQAEWGYASAIRVGDTIYLSGVVAGVRKGETDLTLGYERAFKEIGETLKSAGASWDDVIDITSFHTDLTTQMPAIIRRQESLHQGAVSCLDRDPGCEVDSDQRNHRNKDRGQGLEVRIADLFAATILLRHRGAKTVPRPALSSRA